jgi:transcriptional regulator with XRE-family HTH domain
MKRAGRKEDEEHEVLERRRRQAQASVGTRIKLLRQRRGWSQNELARQCRLTRDVMGAIERGNSNFLLSSLLPIVEKLNTTIAELFTGIA